MKKFIKAWLACILLTTAFAANPKPTVYELAGNWNGVLEFAKMRVRIVLHIAKSNEGKIAATMDIVDQGVKGLPIEAFLFNYPDVRLEFDQIGANFNGAFNPERNEIKGTIDEGPGGKPTVLVFKRAVESSEPKAPLIYSFKPGESRDIRGYWKTTIEPMSGVVMRLGLKIGRDSHGGFEALLDSLDQGAKDIPATSVTYTNGEAKVEWQGILATLNAKLEEDGAKLSGTWKQGPKTIPITFDRLEKAAVAVDEKLSYEPGKDLLTDIRGRWEGALEVPDHTLRLVMKVGRTPDGTYGGSVVSVDQGGVELPTTSMTLSNSNIRVEFKSLRAVYTGTLTNQGKVMDGKWEQMGNPLPLRFERKPQDQKKL